MNDIDGTWSPMGWVAIEPVLNTEPSLEEKLDALMAHLGLEFKKIPEKLEVKKK